MMNQIFQETKIHMEKCVNIFKKKIKNIRIGRAIPDILHDIKVEYYGIHYTLHQLANIVTKDYNTLSVTAFDPILIPIIKKSIASSNLDLNPILNGSVIHVPFPPITKERRCSLIKIIRNEAENSKISIRNIRRNANDKIKKLLKEKIIDMNDNRGLHNNIQKLTSIWIEEVDNILINKEKELTNL